MEIPSRIDLHESNSSIFWLDEDGILCRVSKKTPPQTLEQAKLEIEEFKKKFGNKPRCMLLDITNATPTAKNVREYAAAEIAKGIKAVAMISNSAFGKMVANFFFTLKPPPYPTKMFSNEMDAKVWLRLFL